VSGTDFSERNLFLFLRSYGAATFILIAISIALEDEEDKIQSFELAEKEEIYLESNGHGIVVSQEPSAGSKKSMQAKVKLQFQEPVYE
jgi:hypothetical protein